MDVVAASEMSGVVAQPPGIAASTPARGDGAFAAFLAASARAGWAAPAPAAFALAAFPVVPHAEAEVDSAAPAAAQGAVVSAAVAPEPGALPDKGAGAPAVLADALPVPKMPWAVRADGGPVEPGEPATAALSPRRWGGPAPHDLPGREGVAPDTAGAALPPHFAPAGPAAALTTANALPPATPVSKTTHQGPTGAATALIPRPTYPEAARGLPPPASAPDGSTSASHQRLAPFAEALPADALAGLHAANAGPAPAAATASALGQPQSGAPEFAPPALPRADRATIPQPAAAPAAFGTLHVPHARPLVQGAPSVPAGNGRGANSSRPEPKSPVAVTVAANSGLAGSNAGPAQEHAPAGEPAPSAALAPDAARGLATHGTGNAAQGAFTADARAANPASSGVAVRVRLAAQETPAQPLAEARGGAADPASAPSVAPSQSNRAPALPTPPAADASPGLRAMPPAQNASAAPPPESGPARGAPGAEQTPEHRDNATREAAALQGGPPSPPLSRTATRFAAAPRSGAVPEAEAGAAPGPRPDAPRPFSDDPASLPTAADNAPRAVAGEFAGAALRAPAEATRAERAALPASAAAATPLAPPGPDAGPRTAPANAAAQPPEPPVRKVAARVATLRAEPADAATPPAPLGLTDRTPAPAPLAAPHATPPEAAHPVLRQIAQSLALLPDRPVELTLAPEELGRVRLTLATSEQGVSVSVQAERPDTLELIRRNIDHLARDFRDLGYSSIAFSFGDRPQQGQPAPPPPTPTAETTPEPAMPPAATPGTAPQRAAAAAAGGLDIRL